MTEGDEDHGRVPMPMSVYLGGHDQGVDLAGRQVLSGAELGVRTSDRGNCSISGWRDQFEVRLCHLKQPPQNFFCS